MRQTLHALAETVYGEPPPSAWLDAFYGLVARLRPRDKRELRWLLFSIEQLPRLSFRPRFSELPLAERERQVSAMARSRIEIRRRGLRVLRNLIYYCIYGQSETWSEIGYGGPWIGRVAVEPAPAPALRPESFEAGE